MSTLGDESARERAEPTVEQLQNADVELVALTYVDNSGIGRVKGVPVGRLADAAVSGVGMSPVFDAFVLDDSITASPSAGGPVGDLRLVPDLDRIVPLAAQPGWAWAPVDRFSRSGDRHPQCQRGFVESMVVRLAEHGLTALMSFEIEWMLSVADGDGFEPATTGPAYGTTRIIELSDYCVELVRALGSEGVPVDQLHPEYASGQFEVSVGPADPLAAADRNLLVRQTIRAVGEREGLRTTFSPSVVTGGVGNGMHLHFSLWDGDSTEVAGGDGPFAITRRFESFLAGVLGSLPSLLAVTAPSVASYLRLQPQRWAGPYRCWGVENREAALRLVEGSSAEIKVVDATTSPYLAVGAVLAAGLAGIDDDLRLPPDIDVDPASLSADELAARGIERLPENLADAVTAFERSDVLREALGVELHETIAAVRRAEIELFADATDERVVEATRWRH